MAKAKAKTKAAAKDTLTLKQRACVQEFFRCGCQTEAYRRAYACSQMQPQTVKKRAWELFQEPKIRAAVDRERDRLRKRFTRDTDRFIERLLEMYYTDLDDVAPVVDGRLVLFDTAALPESARAALRARRQREDETQVELHDRLPTARLLAQIFGLTKDQEHANLPPLVVQMDFRPPSEQGGDGDGA